METNVKILVVDDESNICELLRLYIENDGNECVCVANGKEAIRALKEDRFHVVLLDIMMPEMDGWDACREIRTFSEVPIIMLSAKGETFDKILGIELGADDYVVKPFDPKEVMARIKAVLRRANSSNAFDNKVLEYPGLKIDLNSYIAYLDGAPMQMPPKEIELLFFLASNPNKVYTREQILGVVWDFDFYGDTRTVDVHMKRIREKTENHSGNWELKTVWGVGYKFEVN